MRHMIEMVAPTLAVLGLLTANVYAAPLPDKKPKVEVVFCLDTTGSMGGLLDGAKAKIWSICNQIAGAKPTPDLKVGLVAYKDKGDSYVTKVFDLTTDLDSIHTELRKFIADGGGDTPEHVNQALYDAVHKIKWSNDKKTLKIIFLVGDAPAHMDYTDDVKYPETCKKAVEKNILINTIQCGTDPECTKQWKDIAAKAEGSYAAIPQSGGVVAIATPHDKRLAEINEALTRTVVIRGAARERAEAERKLDAARDLAKAAPGGPAAPAAIAAAADRAGYAAKSGKAFGGGLDLVEEAMRNGTIDEKVLNSIKEEELSDELKKLKTNKERVEYLQKKADERAKLTKEALELDKKRAAYIAEELKKKGKEKDSFDSRVLEMLKKQAKNYDIDF
ncbi:MAG: vWA domain-containing protein [Gemmataceae bacterium]